MNLVRTGTGYQSENVQVDAKPFSALPTQQAIALLHAAKGLRQKDIAQEMGIKTSTVNKTCERINFTLDTHSMREAVHKAIQQGILRYIFSLFLCVLAANDLDIERAFRTVRTNRTTRTQRLRRRKEFNTDFLLV